MEARERAGARKGLTGHAGARAGAGAHPGPHAPLIRSCLQGRDPTTIQNTLMRMPDKVCAVGLSEITPQERSPIYALLAPQKARRIEDEIRYVARRQTTAQMRARIVRLFISYFEKAGPTGGRIWIRPRKR